MKILVVGSGGREHAVVWKLRQSHPDLDIWCTPGNHGISRHAYCVTGDLSDVEALAAFAERQKFDLTFVGPEAPLVLGVKEAFQARGLRLVGPSSEAAKLEGSKAFAKEFMSRHGIPTAAFEVCESPLRAAEVIDSGRLGLPLVMKADGLAAGKGVVIVTSQREAYAYLESFMVRKTLGDAGDVVVLEQCLTGREFSLLVFTDGEAAVPLPMAQDYKRLLDGDRGPNTGGMGAICTPDLLDETTREYILARIVMPTISNLDKEGRRYRGVLYVGLMLTRTGPMVLEFNARLGDPETQAILPRLSSDLLEILEAVDSGEMRRLEPRWDPRSTACVVLAAGGYPGKYETHTPIGGLDEVEGLENVEVFHAGTTSPNGRDVFTSGGRVLGVTGLDSTLERALDRAYHAVSFIHFDGVQYRRDIGGFSHHGV
ncbi:MAG: phosphoribosylamine--glycine ligase [Acidobacteria bacterium]|nr:phosphoribosylamine--glycine ligase [Acidobacteriota bacterium]